MHIDQNVPDRSIEAIKKLFHWNRHSSYFLETLLAESVRFILLFHRFAREWPRWELVVAESFEKRAFGGGLNRH